MATEEHNNLPFIRNLASSDRKLRTASLASLRSFLSTRHVASSLSPLEILKLWKGLFYALWMCDRAVPQQKLCDELAGLVLRPGAADDDHGGNRGDAVVVVPWLRGFWATMAREWAAIDVYRMNKFMLLVRRVLAASLAWTRDTDKGVGSQRTWDATRLDHVLGLLAEWPFAVADDTQPAARDSGLGALAPPTVPAGLKMHVLDIWVDEAEKEGFLEAGNEGAAAVLARITAMVDALETGTLSPGIRKRAKDSLADERLPGRTRPEVEDVGQGDSWDGFDD